MTEKYDPLLFQSLENAYREDREKFEAARTSEKNRELFENIRIIINESNKDSSDKIRAFAGIQDNGNEIVITAAAFIFDGLIEVGESAVEKSTDWFSHGKREVNGMQPILRIRFRSVDFVKLNNDSQISRPGPVRIEGMLTDTDGISSSFPLVILQEDRGTQQMKMLYPFGSPIEHGTEDYTEVVKIVDALKR